MIDACDVGIMASRDDSTGESGDQELRRLVHGGMQPEVAAIGLQHADRRRDA